MTIREALAEGCTALAAAGIENAGLDASLLLAEALGLSRAFVAAHGPDPLAEGSLAAFRAFINRRQNGECAAYILGRKEFYGLEFLVNPAVLVPRPDTETLVQLTINSYQLSIDDRPLRILDLCTGSGAVAIALKHELPELEVWATDISVEALKVAKANAARLLPPNSIHFCQGNLYEGLGTSQGPGTGDWGLGIDVRKGSGLPTGIASEQSLFLISYFSFLTSNPPYISSAEIAGLSAEVRAEPVLALDGGKDGLDIIRAIISRAPEFLRPGGALLLEADPRQMGEIALLFEKSGFTRIQTHNDLSGRERVISGEKN